jgi:hypothetical protein
MAKKKASAKLSRKTAHFAKANGAGIHVIVDPNAKPSPYAKKALSQFSTGIQRAYKDLARKGVKTVVIENGVRIKAVPHVSGGRFVVGEGLRKKA